MIESTRNIKSASDTQEAAGGGAGRGKRVIVHCAPLQEQGGGRRRSRKRQGQGVRESSDRGRARGRGGSSLPEAEPRSGDGWALVGSGGGTPKSHAAKQVAPEVQPQPQSLAGWAGWGSQGGCGDGGVWGGGPMGAPGGVRAGGVAPGRGGGWGSLLAVCAAGAAGCAVMELGVEKGKEAAGVMADAWRHLHGDWLLLRVECADMAGLSASIKSDDSGSVLNNRESGGAVGAGGGNQSNGSNSSVVSHTSSEIAGGKSSDGAVSRKRVVVLGSGWGAVSFLKAIDTHGYDVTLISPRNFFLFTPLLPSVTTGVVEGRSIAEPIRRILLRQHGSSACFLEAECMAIDPASRTLSCRAPAALPAPLPMPTVAKVGGQEEGDGETTRGGAERKCGGAVDGNVAAAGGNTEGGGGESGGESGGGCGGAREVRFTVPYDMLVVAVGAVPNTFDVPGVQQHCHFLKAMPYDMLVVAVGAVPNTFNVPGMQQHCHFLKVSTVALGTGSTKSLALLPPSLPRMPSPRPFPHPFPPFPLPIPSNHPVPSSFSPIPSPIPSPHLFLPSLLPISSPHPFPPIPFPPSIPSNHTVPPSLSPIPSPHPGPRMSSPPSLIPSHCAPSVAGRCRCHQSLDVADGISNNTLSFDRSSTALMQPPFNPYPLFPFSFPPSRSPHPSPPSPFPHPVPPISPLDVTAHLFLPPPPLSLPSLDDAEAIRNTLIDCFEEACLPGIEADEQQR
ncbi:unnamed protein product [Closterium sp. Naga37s-1]|nr:unnamed protein product [Closterium sp. Naga37s-1]